uniref:Uncharacterized protein n=1 Tax=Arundo donax TaxID=35708 RepID=A0A0A9GVQ4_ARUDO
MTSYAFKSSKVTIRPTDVNLYYCIGCTFNQRH